MTGHYEDKEKHSGYPSASHNYRIFTGISRSNVLKIFHWEGHSQASTTFQGKISEAII
jgi:hypothetical protein